MSDPTFNTVAAILQQDFRVAPEDIAPGAALAGLGLDSLALMEFVFAVEDAFHLRISEDKLDPREAGITLQRLCEVIDEASAGAAPAPSLVPAHA